MDTESSIPRINHYELKQILLEKELMNPSVSNLMAQNQGCVLDKVGTDPVTNQPIYGFRKVTSQDYLPKELREEPVFQPMWAPKPVHTDLHSKNIFQMVDKMDDKTLRNLLGGN